MADRKITDLTALAAGSQATGDLLTIVDVSESAAADKNKKITVENLFQGIPGDVGIGASSSLSAALTVVANTNAEAINVRGRSSDNVGEINFWSNDESTRYAKISARSSYVELRGPDAGSIRFNAFDGTERARIDSSGRVLVGTSSARTINTTSSWRGVQIAGTTGFESLIIERYEGSGGPTMLLGKSRGTSVGDYTIVQNNDGLGSFIFFGADGSDMNSQGARIDAFVDGTPGSNSMPGRLVFSTSASGAASPTERMRIDSSGNVIVNESSATNTPTNGITLMKNGSIGSIGIGHGTGTATGNTYAHFCLGGTSIGTITQNGTNAVSYNTSSDYRLKENVVDISDAITRVKELRPKRFNFISDTGRTVDGFLAHETQTVVPEAVTGTHDEVETWKEGQELPDGVSVGDNKLDEDGNTIPVYQGIDQSKLVPLLTAALQEAIVKIETLETSNADLLARVTALEAG